MRRLTYLIVGSLLASCGSAASLSGEQSPLGDPKVTTAATDVVAIPSTLAGTDGFPVDATIPFNVDPTGGSGRELATFSDLASAANESAVGAGVKVTLFDPSAAVPGLRFFVDSAQAFATAKDLLIVEQPGGSDAAIVNLAKRVNAIGPSTGQRATLVSTSTGDQCLYGESPIGSSFVCYRDHTTVRVMAAPASVWTKTSIERIVEVMFTTGQVVGDSQAPFIT